MLVKDPAEYTEPDKDNETGERLLPEKDRNENALLGSPPPQMVVLI
jgi:hypothetical protein